MIVHCPCGVTVLTSKAAGPASTTSAGASSAKSGGGSSRDDSKGGNPDTGDAFDLFHLLEAARPPTDAPEEPTPAGMSCRLLPYQRKALAWMAAVETGWLGASLGSQLHPAWMELCVDVNGRSGLWSATHADVVREVVDACLHYVLMLREPAHRNGRDGSDTTASVVVLSLDAPCDVSSADAVCVRVCLRWRVSALGVQVVVPVADEPRRFDVDAVQCGSTSPWRHPRR